MRALFLILVSSVAVLGQSFPIVTTHVEGSAPGSPRVWNVGDIDGDQRDDFGVTASGLSSQGSSPGTQVQGYVVRSTTGVATTLTQPSAVTPGLLRYPRALYPIADRDGDGVGDFVAEFPREAGPLGSTPAPVSLRFYSGLTAVEIGSVVYNLLVEDQIEFSPAGDRNGDGIEDYLVAYEVATPFFPTSLTTSRIEVIDGATLGTLTFVDFPGGLRSGGIAVLGDIDGDGIEDFATGSQSWSLPLNNGGSTFVFSGGTGMLLATFTGAAADGLGARIVCAGDLTGDGISEVASLEAGYMNGVGRIRIFDPVAGVQIRQHVLLQPAGSATNSILDLYAAGDHDGDGVQDLAFVRGTGTSTTEMVWLSGVTGSTIHQDFFDASVRPWPVSDMNADGIADFARVPVSMPVSMPRTIEFRTTMGAQSYGVVSGGRDLRWLPGTPEPRVGILRFTGVLASVPLLVGVSLAPANDVIFGTNFPLLISLQAQHLVLTANETSDAFGVRDVFLDLSEPSLSGFVFHVQYAELGALPGTSNAVELLFGP